MAAPENTVTVQAATAHAMLRNCLDACKAAPVPRKKADAEALVALTETLADAVTWAGLAVARSVGYEKPVAPPDPDPDPDEELI